MRLFTDGTELIVGSFLDAQCNKKKKVIRLIYSPNLRRKSIIANINRLRGLIPDIVFHIGSNNQWGLFLIDYVDGREPTEEEINIFKNRLRKRGIDPNKFDLNKGNLIISQEGNFLLVDLEEIIFLE